MASTVETDTNGRTADGKFSIGNRAAAGHKRRQHIARLRAAFTAALTESDILSLVVKLQELAAGGDVTAIRLLLDRALGRVASPVEFECVDDLMDAETDLQAAIRRVQKMDPNCPANLLERKARLMLDMERLTPEQQASVAQKLRERKAAREAVT